VKFAIIYGENMGVIADFTGKKLVIPLLLSSKQELDPVKSVLSEDFGPVDFTSDPMDFTFTPYYEPEMGSAIRRQFLSFASLVSPDLLAGIKIRTNEMEEMFTAAGKRQVNMDPGLLDASRFILATTKDNAHRIPLSRGIYGEITLLFAHKEFRDLPWTYPDYKTEAYKRILMEIRTIFCAQVKQRE
jgi:hypothetical protein